MIISIAIVNYISIRERPASATPVTKRAFKGDL